VVNPVKLLQEIQEVEAAGLLVRDRLRISSQASVVQPSHILQDQMTMASVGTTGNGIGVTYGMQALRVAEGGRRLDVRLGELLTDTETAFEMINLNLVMAQKEYGVEVYTTALMHELRLAFEALKDNIDCDPERLTKEIRKGARVLLEGAQAFGLDRTFGVTPNITSSNTGVAAAFLSTGIPVDYKRYAYGVAKLTPSRVGYGPFVTELGGKRSEDHCMKEGGKTHSKAWEQMQFGSRIDELFASTDELDVGIATRIDGGEYGASTGRPRRMGDFDMPFLRYGINMNGLDGLFLTKGDKLSVHRKRNGGNIRMATGYKLDGKGINYVPTTDTELRRVVPVYSHFPPFYGKISDIRQAADLPSTLVDLLHEIQDQVGCDILELGVGPERDQRVKFGAKDL
jgi:adenylosuccinate synthase